MRIWILGIILTVALAIFGFFLLQARDDRAREEAKRLDTISAYETFIVNYPNSEYVSVAGKALALCQEKYRWDELKKKRDY
jgi:outer membrane protein assembly factor BamD (BamD/ComL family)